MITQTLEPLLLIISLTVNPSSLCGRYTALVLELRETTLVPYFPCLDLHFEFTIFATSPFKVSAESDM